MLTYRDLPASAAVLEHLTQVVLQFAAEHPISEREVQALLDAVRARVCAALAEGDEGQEEEAPHG